MAKTDDLTAGASAAEALPSPALSVPPFDYEKFADAMVKGFRGEGEAARLRDMDALQAQRKAEEDARAMADTVTLVAVTSWNEHSNVSPTATKTIKQGDEITISVVDLHKYAGKALPRAPDPTNGGVTISSAPQPSF